MHALDPTRPVTQAINNGQPLSTNAAAVLDVAAYNYNAELFTKDHAKLPDKVMFTAEFAVEGCLPLLARGRDQAVGGRRFRLDGGRLYR